MPALMKKHLTKVTIGNEEFSLPSKEAKALLYLVKGLSKTIKTENISSKEVFKDLLKNRPKGAVYLRGLRVRENMSQKELERKTGIPVTNISKYENGSRKITKEAAKKFEKALKSDFKKFLN